VTHGAWILLASRRPAPPLPPGALEITNGLLVAERRKRVKPLDVRRFVDPLGSLTIIEHSQTVADTVGNVLPLIVTEPRLKSRGKIDINARRNRLAQPYSLEAVELI
jgi:hypothetical protein